MLIDTHTHLTDSRLDAQQIIADMQADGLEKLITVGYDFDSSIKGLELAERHDNVFCSLGIHPSDTSSAQMSQIDKIAALLSHKKVVAAGEIGLDYHYDDTDRECQKKFLIAQIEAYSGCGVPLIFHLREADLDMHSIIRDRLHLIKSGAVMHCFSGSYEVAQSYIKMGFYLSFSGTITFNNAKKFPQIIKGIPRERILVETDCPYLAPQPKRGQLNRPAFVGYTASKVAQILELSDEQVHELTRQNAYNLFAKMQAS